VTSFKEKENEGSEKKVGGRSLPAVGEWGGVVDEGRGEEVGIESNWTCGPGGNEG